ncbi:hypothetical protein Taro_045222 [Colocasia esculenta]|uniref:Protein kinase domain-containing protein n=1 Tax=Colocasia esculenta TaxID=4460 RepID=A0A843WNX7_COLES|nr:hypothetical protein [Colocasia esculenta]
MRSKEHIQPLIDNKKIYPHFQWGCQVAVKLLSRLSSQGPKEFRAEAVLLTRVHHKNLVCLLGYCQDQYNLALVYEYMDQGTLQDHLSGLDYLHNGCRPPIIHRDVKSSNILLNSEFIAKLADFGLSRAFNDEKKTDTSTAVAGTAGYLDPELNEKSDVYSFGIVLLEILTGQPVFSSWPERRHIAQWVQSRLESGDGINSIVDTRLCGDYNTNSARKLLEIAMTCTFASSMRRPAMSDVMTQLKGCLQTEVARDIIDDSGMPSVDSVQSLP